MGSGLKTTVDLAADNKSSSASSSSRLSRSKEMPAATTTNLMTTASGMGTPSRPGADDKGLRTAVLDAFPARLLPRESPVVSSLVSLLRVYSSQLTAEDLFYKMEAILVSERADGITQEMVEQARQSIAQEWEKEMSTSTSSAHLAAGTPAKGSHAFATPGPKSVQHQQAQRAGLGSFLGISPNTPATPLHGAKRFTSGGAQQVSAALGSPAPLRRPAAADASNVGTSSAQPRIVETLNPHIAAASGSSSAAMDLDGDSSRSRADGAGQSRVALAIGTDPRTWNYRYMFERPGVKGHALDEQVEAMTQSILQTYGIADEDLADPSMPSQESVYVVGRVAPTVTQDEKTSATGHAKLSEGMIIETSRRIGSGSRTPLLLANNVKVRSLKDASGQQYPHSSSTGAQVGLFPGLIAGFRGRNGGGDGFIVEEILMPPSLPPAATPVEDLLKHQYGPGKLDGEPLQVMIASGPFTNDKDLDFRPWHRFMDQVEQQLPDVVLLLGPFLPANNAALLDPDLDEMPQTIFERHISQRLNRLCEKTARTTTILLPSTRDIVSPHAAWPQPMFDKAQLGLHKRVKCLPNPCLFSINEIIVGVSTADVLRDIRAEEIVVDLGSQQQQQAQSNERDAMARSVRHLLNQRHFYPLYPASMASEVPLDVSHAGLAAFTRVSPDVLLLPSVLTPFAKVVDGSVVVNPGPMAKGAGAAATAPADASAGLAGSGTFVQMQVQPLSRDALQDAQAAADKAEDIDVEESSAKMQHSLYDRTRIDIVRL